MCWASSTASTTEWQAPPWLEQTSAWSSVGVLIFLGLVNLVAVLRTPIGERVPLIGLRGRWLVDRLAGATHPAVIASVGAAFALSFDTVSHALLFSVSGWGFAAALGCTFTLGMMLTDALNSFWVARMMTPANRRWMSLAIALLCLGIAGASLIEHAVPMPVISIATFVVILAACVLASRSAYREARP